MNRWNIKKTERKIVSDLTLKCGISTLTAAVLASRGYTSLEDVIGNFETEELSDPFLLKDMQIASDVINEAIDSGAKICVYGDYDCDGIMSTVMLYSYLTETGADVFYYIPERSEGYGLNPNAIKFLADEGAELIITVDNGISAIDEADLIYELGMRLVVTDHHQTGEVLPKAEAVIDPHRSDCFSPFKYLCGAGVVLKLIAALDGGDYTMALEQFGDLAAIATVADIVSLTSENRFIVSYGLRLIENTDRPALEALKEVSSLNDKKTDSTSVGFGLAPRINAAGRFGSPRTAVHLFLSEDEREIECLAAELNDLNNQRKEEENKILNEIYTFIENNPQLIRRRVIFLFGKNWHHGVIGIIASRISEKYGKPCFIASDSDGEIRGSARSFEGFSVFGALTACSEALEKFGGHPGAGGFTIKNGMAERFNELLQQYAFENHKQMPMLTITADASVSPAELNVKDVESLTLLEPFGCGNEKPLFFIENARVLEIIPLSNGAHSKIKLKFGYIDIQVLIFRTPPHELKMSVGDECDFIATLDINTFKGNKSVSIVIKDYRNRHTEHSKIIAANSAFEAFLNDEELPMNYYKSMYPTRDEVAAIYVKIPSEGINIDVLFFLLKNPQINYCKFLIGIEALRQLGLISFKAINNSVCRVKVEKRVDLQTAPVLTLLKHKILK